MLVERASTLEEVWREWSDRQCEVSVQRLPRIRSKAVVVNADVEGNVVGWVGPKVSSKIVAVRCLEGAMTAEDAVAAAHREMLLRDLRSDGARAQLRAIPVAPRVKSKLVEAPKRAEFEHIYVEESEVVVEQPQMLEEQIAHTPCVSEWAMASIHATLRAVVLKQREAQPPFVAYCYGQSRYRVPAFKALLQERRKLLSTAEQPPHVKPFAQRDVDALLSTGLLSSAAITRLHELRQQRLQLASSRSIPVL